MRQVRGRAGAARESHNLQVGGSNPPPATKPRALAQHDYLRLKTATRALIGAVGGIDGAAASSRVGRSEMSRYQDPHALGVQMPVDVVADLEAACGVPFVTRALAARAEHALIPLLVPGEPAALSRHLSAVAKEFAELVAAATAAQADGVLDRHEIDDIEREAVELEARLHAFRGWIGARRREGDAPPARPIEGRPMPGRAER